MTRESNYLKVCETTSVKGIEGKGPNLSIFRNEWGQ